MSHQDALTSYISAFVAELAQTGLKDVVISPGSRSTPMAMIMAEHPDLRIHVHVDERSAAFFALGIAKASRRPVAILCTSGTAAANYYPAVVEAFYSRIPLIVLTADRPHELRDIGAPQTIDQIHLFGRHVKWFVEMAPPENSNDMIRYVRTVCARAAATALTSPAGPVHLNFPFREPLIPDLDREDLFHLEERGSGQVQVERGIPVLSSEQQERFVQELNKYKRGVIVCGSLENEKFPEAVISLSEKLKFPIIADPLSQLRSGGFNKGNIIDTYSSFLKNSGARAELKPEIVIRFGAMPVSKFLMIFIKEHSDARQWVIDSGWGWRDPTLLSAEMIYAEEAAFCESIASKLEERHDTVYLSKWQQINKIAKEQLEKIKEVSGASEGKVFAELARLLPDEAALFVGNSMPIRDLDTFFHANNKRIRIFGNRGANGIDGTVSSALGAGTVCQPLYLIVGDLTFYHDMSALILSKLYGINITIIVLNNNGGGIFSFLPQAKQPRNFEKLFGTPLNITFEKIVEMYGGNYAKCEDWAGFESALKKSAGIKGLNVIELMTNREDNYKEHEQIEGAVSREISRFLQV